MPWFWYLGILTKARPYPWHCKTPEIAEKLYEMKSLIIENPSTSTNKQINDGSTWNRKWTDCNNSLAPLVGQLPVHRQLWGHWLLVGTLDLAKVRAPYVTSQPAIKEVVDSGLSFSAAAFLASTVHSSPPFPVWFLTGYLTNFSRNCRKPSSLIVPRP